MSANINETVPYELLGAHDLRVDLGATTILQEIKPERLVY